MADMNVNELAEDLYLIGANACLKRNVAEYKNAFERLLENDKTGQWIYNAGFRWLWFDYERAFEKLLEVDNIGKWICYAGQEWEWFDFERAFNRLLEVDKTGEFIYRAGEGWKQFDYERALDKLLEVDKIGQWIYHAGKHWKKFDYRKALQKLLEIDKTGEWIYEAGRAWKDFDYKQAAEALLKLDDMAIYKACRDWKWFDYNRAIEILLTGEYNKFYMLAIAKEWQLAANGLVDKFVDLVRKILGDNDDKYFMIKVLLDVLTFQKLDDHQKEKILQEIINLNYYEIDEINQQLLDLVRKGIIVKAPTKEFISRFLDDICL